MEFGSSFAGSMQGAVGGYPIYYPGSSDVGPMVEQQPVYSYGGGYGGDSYAYGAPLGGEAVVVPSLPLGSSAFPSPQPIVVSGGAGDSWGDRIGANMPHTARSSYQERSSTRSRSVGGSPRRSRSSQRATSPGVRQASPYARNHSRRFEPEESDSDDELRYAKYMRKDARKLNQNKYQGLAPRLYNNITPDSNKGHAYLKHRSYSPGRVGDWSRGDNYKSIPNRNQFHNNGTNREPRGVREEVFVDPDTYDVHRQPSRASRALSGGKQTPGEPKSAAAREWLSEVDYDPVWVQALLDSDGYAEDQPLVGATRLPRLTRTTNTTIDCRRAVVIGLDYEDDRGARRHTGNNDADAMGNLLRRFGFHPRYIKTLKDCLGGMDDTATLPTFNNIVDHCRWLVKDARAGDHLFFFFSGRSSIGEVPRSGRGTTIAPSDWQEAGLMVDDVLYHLLVESLPKGARLTVVIDTDSDETSLDLPYMGDHKTGLLCCNPADRIRGDVLCFSGATGVRDKDQHGSGRLGSLVRRGVPIGGMAAAFISSIVHAPHTPPSVQDVIKGMRAYIKDGAGYDKLPMVSASKAYTLFQPFNL